MRTPLELKELIGQIANAHGACCPFSNVRPIRPNKRMVGGVDRVPVPVRNFFKLLRSIKLRSLLEKNKDTQRHESSDTLNFKGEREKL